MDAVTPTEPAAAQVEAALGDLDKALKGLEWSAEFSRVSAIPLRKA